MKSPLARQLARLYPEDWRIRYGQEFEYLLEELPASARSIFDVIAWAIHERLRYLGEFTMDRRQHALALMLFACLVASAAGANFYWTVDDTPLAPALHAHPPLVAIWSIIRFGALLAFLAAASLLASIVATALRAQRYDVIRWLAVPPCAAVALLIWLVAGTALSGGQWIPTPWDVGGDWTAPVGWPPLTTRWTLSSITVLLMAAGLVSTAISLRQAIRRTDVSRYTPFWFAGASIVLAASIAMMAAGVLAWGWFVEQYAASAFHARNGGFFSSTNLASWTGSLVVSLAAAGMAFRGARAARSLNTE